MNKLLLNSWKRYADIGVLILRVSIGLLMITHGWPKLNKFFADEPIKFGDPLGIGKELSLALAVFAELFCSIFLTLGLFTRLASVPLFITMAVAAFISHVDDPLSKKEHALMYMICYIYFMFAGGGKYSIDKKLER